MMHHVRAATPEKSSTRALTTLPRPTGDVFCTQVPDFVDLNFEPILALFGAAARSACARRICSGRQGGGGHNYSSRAAPLHAARRSNAPISQQSLPPPCVPSIASSTPARAAHASHAPMHPIPITPRKPCNPRCPSHVHFLALRSAPREASRKPPPAVVPRAAPPWPQAMILDSIVAYYLRLN